MQGELDICIASLKKYLFNPDERDKFDKERLRYDICAIAMLIDELKKSPETEDPVTIFDDLVWHLQTDLNKCETEDGALLYLGLLDSLSEYFDRFF